MFSNRAFFLCAFIASISLLFGQVSAADSTAKAPPTMEQLKKQYERPKNIPYPAFNPYSDAKFDLGKALYFDPRLSKSGVTSCATCHNPSLAWGDGLGKSVGFSHQILGRKSPTILNLAWDILLFWDGRAESLEEQSLGPIAASGEMNLPLDEMEKRINSIAGYKALFTKAFPESNGVASRELVAKAIATFERKAATSGEAPFDRWIKGNENAISAEAKQGFMLFNTKAQCASCHLTWRFSDQSFHDIGLKDDQDRGRGKLDTDLEIMQYAFKTPGLRDISRRAPYMHDGSINTLEAVIDHYADGFVRRPSLSGNMKPFQLSDPEKKALIAFLQTLTSDKNTPISLPDLPY
jgi:cytochrome c peroxidase